MKLVKLFVRLLLHRYMTYKTCHLQLKKETEGLQEILENFAVQFQVTFESREVPKFPALNERQRSAWAPFWTLNFKKIIPTSPPTSSFSGLLSMTHHLNHKTMMLSKYINLLKKPEHKERWQRNKETKMLDV